VDRFAVKLKSLGYLLPRWATPPTKDLVATFEDETGLQLPADYRDFLSRFGGWSGSCLCPIREPCPCGSPAVVEGFLGFMRPEERRLSCDVRGLRLLADIPSNFVPIADGVFGGMIWLKLADPGSGCVYFHDGEGRSAWAEETFRERFPALAEQIAEYLVMRRHAELPAKPEGHENLYFLAESFSDFLAACEPDGSS
jgi:hypothetical protein